MTKIGLRRLTRSPASLPLAGYLLVSFLFFGLRPLLEHGSQFAGPHDDSQIFIWAFAWWPHAIGSGINPFTTDAVWAPSGLNLAWATSVPGLSLLFAPITMLVGPVASFNVAAVVVPALDAWAAFLLCRRLTGAIWPSFAGGYLFGFSSYVITQQSAGHLNLTSVFVIPLVALAIVDFVGERLDQRRLVKRLAPLFALQVLISTEIAFALGLALLIGGSIALAVYPVHRQRLRELVKPLGISAVSAALLTAPFLWYMLKGFHSGTFNRPEAYVADVVNYVVPTHVSLLGGGWTGWLSMRGNDGENGAFLGPAVLVVFVLYAIQRWRSPAGRLLLLGLGATVVVSFGQLLTVNGKGVLELPWRWIVDAPLFNNLLTSRLTSLVALLVAIIVATWAAARSRGSISRIALPALAMIALVPNPGLSVWATTYTIPEFFTNPGYRHCLDRGENVLPLPIWVGSQAKLWQVETGFRFRLAGGGVSPLPPEEFEHPYRIQYIAHGYKPAPREAEWLRRYIEDKHVTSAIVEFSQRETWEPLMNQFATGQVVGGIVLYHFSDTAPSCTPLA